MESTELRRRLHLGRDVTGLETVDLVQDDHDRDPEAKNATRYEAIAGAYSLACVDDEQHSIDVTGHRVVDAALHPLGQRVDRLLPAGQVDEHELCIVVRVHAA